MRFAHQTPSAVAPIAEYHITNAPISRCWNEKVFASTNVQPTKLISTANGTNVNATSSAHAEQAALVGWLNWVCVCACVHVIYGTIAYYWINKEIEFIRYHRALWADVRQQRGQWGEKNWNAIGLVGIVRQLNWYFVFPIARQFASNSLTSANSLEANVRLHETGMSNGIIIIL